LQLCNFVSLLLKNKMIYPKIPLAQSIIEIFRVKGIKNIVISPGSRNAPLTIGFVNNPNFTCYSIADERCAGFFALGIAQQKQQPTALICTSGSALLNYYPAFAEAFYSQIPLIVVSADRPQEKIDIGDGQTIRQENVFANHSFYNANLLEKASEDNDFKIQDAIYYSISKRGPVHINVPFEEPLYETTIQLEVTPIYVSKNKIPTQVENLEQFASIWNKSSKKMILVGECFPNCIEDQFTDIIANDNSVVVMTETISNWHHPSFINNIDTIISPLSEEELIDFQPEILITFGGMIVSKRVKAMLRKYKPKHHWHIDELRAYDVFGCLSHHFVCHPNEFFTKFISFLDDSESNYRQKGQVIKEHRAQKHMDYLDTIPFSDFKAFEIILPSLPKNSILQLGNSSTIRYAQLFDIDKTIEIFCNRGTSGIDGCTSTAIGAAVASQKQTVFITGDIGFLYDSNALWNNYIPNNFKIILINNGGGGIFRILPGHDETPIFNTFFETSHCLTAKHLAKMYNLDYLIASSVERLETELDNFYEINKPAILEVFTPTKTNESYLLDYFKKLN
jgi:2-succinyl-5-enolpyruvyl-6-hydroxy-3-cyclohexene-1-carboxylate synthase